MPPATRFSLPAAVLLIACLVSPTLVQAQSPEKPSRTRFLQWAYQDAFAFAQSADARTLGYAAGAVAVLTPLSLLDSDVDYHLRQPSASPFGGYLDFANELGGPGMKLPVTGIFLATLATNNTRLQDAAFTSLQAMVYAGVISYSIKFTVGRFRPYEQDGPYRFAPFSGHTSFPSGHTVSAFAIVTPWVLYYPHPITYGLFALSTGTAVARIARDKHWSTDVLAGGSIGFLTAYWLTRRHQSDTARLSITPVLAGEDFGVALRVKL